MGKKNQNALARLRRRAGYRTQVEAAEKLGISPLHMSNIERGAGAPSFELLAKMAKLYAPISTDTLMRYVEAAQREYHERMLDG